MVKILVIDDDELIRTTLRRMLQAAGYAVVEAVDGDDGLRRFESEQPDLVLADILMPNKEGLETIRELRRMSQSVAIIAMSGGVGTGDFRSRLRRPAWRRSGAAQALHAHRSIEGDRWLPDPSHLGRLRRAAQHIPQRPRQIDQPIGLGQHPDIAGQPLSVLQRRLVKAGGGEDLEARPACARLAN